MAEVRLLRAEGLNYAEIGKRLGLSRSTVSSYYTDPDGSKRRAQRDGYRGICENCGRYTNGEGPGKAARFCHLCWHKMQPPKAFWTREKIITAIRSWYLTYGEPPGIRDWNSYEATLAGQLERARRFKCLTKARLVPWFTIVIREFGSWNAAIEAAGYTPRPPHGTSETNAKRTHCKNGHEFTEENTVVRSHNGKRYRRCRICEREYQHQRQMKRRKQRGVVLTDIFSPEVLAR